MTRVRDWIGLQKEMVQEIGSILSILLLTINLGISVYLLVRSDSGTLANPYIVIPAIILATGIAVWLIARSWHFVGMMHKSKQRAVVMLNPYLTTDFNPHEWIIWKEVSLPQLHYTRAMLLKLGLDTKDIDARIRRVEAWLDKGRIPKEEFPPRFAPFLRAV